MISCETERENLGSRKKDKTLQKLDRSRVLPFYITREESILYDRDSYKYLIHALKCFPNDQYHILQYLLLKFHPLIISLCRKYESKGIMMDWLDLVSFARASFVELIYRFDLTSGIYFPTYIPIALDRCIRDYHMYHIRRKALMRCSVSMDSLPENMQHSIINTHMDCNDHGSPQHEQVEQAQFLSHCKEEIFHFIEKRNTSERSKLAFKLVYFEGKTIPEVALELEMSATQTKKVLEELMVSVKEYLRTHFF
jgi:RNA polymerase sigma factor (sigma-70 family)